MPLTQTDFYRAKLASLHQALLACPIGQAYFTGENIRFDGRYLGADDHFKLPDGNIQVSTIEFAQLFAAFNGSRIHQQIQREVIDGAPPGLYFTVINPRVIQSPHKNRSGIYLDASGDSDLFIESLHIDHFFLDEHKTPSALGTVAFALCAITAHLAGLSRISLIAAGGRGYDERYIGFKVWPKLGFDAPLAPGEVDGVRHLVGCRTVQDVLDVDALWWEANGNQRPMVFDLSADSVSWAKLLAYVTGKLSSVQAL